MRLSTQLLRVLYTRQYHPVIVEIDRSYFADIASIIDELNLAARVMKRSFIEEVVPFGFYGRIPRFNMVSAILATRDIEALADMRGIRRIYLDRPMYVFQFPTVETNGVFQYRKMRFTTTVFTKKALGADEANRRGWTGRDIKVAVVDTGAVVYHEQLGMRYMETSFDTTMPLQRTDENGHGTWCCAAIGGARAVDEYLSMKVGKKVEAEGLAPEVHLYCIKSLGYLVGTGSTSNIIKGIEMAVDWGAKVISMSLGGPCDSEKPDDDPFYPVMEEITKQGVIPVVAAGNEGPKPQTIGSPGCMPQVLTVGAYDPVTGEVADFSSRGPTPWGDVKPDISMPGVNILAASTGLLDAVDHVIDRYGILSGTSMATPHASGMVAIMAQIYRDVLGSELTVDEIKRMMAAWADEHGITKSNDYGWGPLTWEIIVWWLNTQYGATV